MDLSKAAHQRLATQLLAAPVGKDAALGTVKRRFADSEDTVAGVGGEDGDVLFFVAVVGGKGGALFLRGHVKARGCGYTDRRQAA